MESLVLLLSTVVFFVLSAWAIRERQKLARWMRVSDAIELPDEKVKLERRLEDEKVTSARKIADLEKELATYYKEETKPETGG